MELLNKEQVKHVADLAHIALTEQEEDMYLTQLNDILNEIKKIEEVNVDNEEIMISSVDKINCYKEDVPGIMDKRDEILKNSKLRKGDFIVVPKVLND